MATDSLFMKVFYPDFQDEKLDKAITKLALSYDGHWVGQGQTFIAPVRRDIEFEFSNEQRMEMFIGEFQKKHSDMNVLRHSSVSSPS